jgi:hypothetical protein
MPTYYEKLKMPEWLLLRQRLILERGRKCQRCGCNDRALEIHHGYYRPATNPWDYEERTLWVLCRDCHQTIQELTICVHRTIAHMAPDELPSLRLMVRDAAFEVRFGASRDVIEDILESERTANASLYSEYSASITNCSDLGPSREPEISELAEREFPGIAVFPCYYDTGRDAATTVDGPNPEVRSQIQAWFDKWNG